MVYIKKHAHYFVLAILLLLAVFVLALPKLTNQKYAEEMFLRDEIVFAADLHEKAVKFESRNAKEYDLGGNVTFERIKPILGDQGFYPLQVTGSSAIFGKIRNCDDLGSWTSVFEKSESEYLAVSYRYKMSLTGCKPVVAKALYAEVSN